MPRKYPRVIRKLHGDNQVAGLEHVIPLRRVARKTMKGLERNFAPASCAFDLDDGVKGDERHAEVRRVCSEAGLTPAQYRLQSVLAIEGGTTGARLALVTGAGCVVEI